MILFRLSTRQGYVVATLGALSGYYIWNKPLKDYAEKHFAEVNLDKVRKYLMANHRVRVSPPNGLFIGMAVVMGFFFAYKFYFKPHISRSGRQQLEEEANILYEQYKKSGKI